MRLRRATMYYASFLTSPNVEGNSESLCRLARIPVRCPTSCLASCPLAALALPDTPIVGHPFRHLVEYSALCRIRVAKQGSITSPSIASGQATWILHSTWLERVTQHLSHALIISCLFNPAQHCCLTDSGLLHGIRGRVLKYLEPPGLRQVSLLPVSELRVLRITEVFTTMGTTSSKEQRRGRTAHAPGSNTQPSNEPDGNANPKSDGLLAWPGRDAVDPRAPYFFKDVISVEFLQAGGYHSQSRAGALASGSATVAFFEIVGNKEQRMPEDGLYERQAWVVGAAANSWRIVREAPPAVNQRLAHWGVYIRPQSASEQVGGGCV